MASPARLGHMELALAEARAAAARGEVPVGAVLVDPTGEVVAAGDTLNCFQLESPAMRNLLRMLAGGTLDATVAAVALVRPGPAESGAKEAFCRRRRGPWRPACRCRSRRRWPPW